MRFGTQYVTIQCNISRYVLSIARNRLGKILPSLGNILPSCFSYSRKDFPKNAKFAWQDIANLLYCRGYILLISLNTNFGMKNAM
jgi:hypothetical protein